MRNTANFFASSGVENSKRFACSGITPLAVDEKLRIWIDHECSFLNYLYFPSNKPQIESQKIERSFLPLMTHDICTHL
jgi:hypothetical protein